MSNIAIKQKKKMFRREKPNRDGKKTKRKFYTILKPLLVCCGTEIEE